MYGVVCVCVCREVHYLVAPSTISDKNRERERERERENHGGYSKNSKGIGDVRL